MKKKFLVGFFFLIGFVLLSELSLALEKSVVKDIGSMPDPDAEAVRNKVCARCFLRQSTNIQATFQGKTYYFCSKACAEAFSAEPKKYVKFYEDAEKIGEPAAAKAEVTGKEKVTATIKNTGESKTEIKTSKEKKLDSDKEDAKVEKGEKVDEEKSGEASSEKENKISSEKTATKKGPEMHFAKESY